MRKLQILLLAFVLLLVGCAVKETDQIVKDLEEDGFDVQTTFPTEDEKPTEEELKQSILASNRLRAKKETNIQYYEFNNNQKAKEYFDQQIDVNSLSVVKQKEKPDFDFYDFQTDDAYYCYVRKDNVVFFSYSLESKDIVYKYLRKFHLNQ